MNFHGNAVCGISRRCVMHENCNTGLLLVHLSRGSGEAYSIAGSVVRRPSVRPSNFSSGITGSIVTKFGIQPPGPIGTKSCCNRLGHLTKTAPMPTDGKTLKHLLQNQ